MKNPQKTKQVLRQRRHTRTRAKISGTAERPRITVFKSNKAVSVQAIDDTTRKTLASFNDSAVTTKKVSVPDDFKQWGPKAQRAYVAGQKVAEGLKKLGVSTVVFDTSGFKYHGRVQAVAEGLRQSGITV